LKFWEEEVGCRDDELEKKEACLFYIRGIAARRKAEEKQVGEIPHTAIRIPALGLVTLYPVGFHSHLSLSLFLLDVQEG